MDRQGIDLNSIKIEDMIWFIIKFLVANCIVGLLLAFVILLGSFIIGVSVI